MQDLIYRKKPILGLDIGTTSIKFAQLKKSGKLTKLVGYGKVAVPEGIIIEGVISEPEKLAEYLKKMFENPPWGKINANRVVASLPEARVFTRILELPVFNTKDIEEAVNYEAEQSIPVPASDLYIDWKLMEEKKDGVVVFMSAAPRAIVDSYVHLFNSLDYEPLAIEISMAAIARSMVSNKEHHEPVIILDFGGQTTNIAVFDSILRVTESHPLGGAVLKKSVMDKLGVSDEEATAMIRQGLDEESKAKSIVEDEVKKIITEIERINDYYIEKSENRKISKVLLCGGLGFMPGLAEYIKDKTGLDSKTGNPWINISVYPLKPVHKEEAPVYAAAIGLCLRGEEDD
jgi:type IV pilus assembly protein PilM